MQTLAGTYRLSRTLDVSALTRAVTGASRSSLIGVGSGGSFTVASLLCTLHEQFTGHVSRPSAPLEIACNPSLASRSPAFFISSEGKNPDIVVAIQRARRHSARASYVLTNVPDSPLVTAARGLEVEVICYPVNDKDGYLATNSLLLNASLIARAYAALDADERELPEAADQLLLGNKTVESWLQGATSFAAETARRGAVIIVYSPSLRSVASDLESKFSEAALLFTQVTDLRSFGHGRHLWFSRRPGDCTLLALVEPELVPLWKQMDALLPPEVPRCVMPVSGRTPKGLIAALVAQMKFVGMVGAAAGLDLASPAVAQFGRDLYYIDLPSLLSPSEESNDRGERAKLAVLGAQWPHNRPPGAILRALQAYRKSIERQRFKAVVFDFDGTLCPSRSQEPPSEIIVKHLCRLTSAGIAVAIVSGRGDSMQQQLRKGVPEDQWEKIHLGLYNGGLVTTLAGAIDGPADTSEFLYHAARIVNQLSIAGLPIEKPVLSQPHQLSIRFKAGVDSNEMWLVIADALRGAGLSLKGLVKSRHSVDILAPQVSKSHVIADLMKRFELTPNAILTIGDQGAWPGNDSMLLDHRFSLSVDIPSRRLDRGWKLCPQSREGVDAALWYLERTRLHLDGTFSLRLGDSSAQEIAS